MTVALTPEEKTREPRRSPSGVEGFDAITNGGLPKGRSSLVCGGPGTGKTIFALQFLVRGAEELHEPGVLVTFDVSPEDLELDAASVGLNLEGARANGSVTVLDMRIDRSEIEQTGAFDLGGLFVRLEHALDTSGAHRVAIDTLETLFAAFDNEAILRAELRRLFDWLRAKNVTSVITAEAGSESLTRNGLEEYLSDCVLVLDHRVTDQIATRRLRIVKFRGSAHGTWEYPFLINKRGISILPISELGLDYDVPREHVSTGIVELDEMLGGSGFFKGSTVLVSGEPGTGKSSLAAHFVDAACKRGERALYFAFEESRDQIVRNMGSIGIDLAAHLESGLLRIEAARPAMHGIEHHLTHMYEVGEEMDPSVVVMDPITDFEGVATDLQAKAMLTRMIDFMKSRQITGLLTSMTSAAQLTSDARISSLVDTWLQVRNLESGGERNRALFVLKSRGMSHSNKVREFLLTDMGISLVDVMVGPDGVLIGSARERATDANEKGSGNGRS